MNNIMFSKMTRRQVKEAYNNKDYKKVLQILTMVFTNKRNFKEYLDKYKEIDMFKQIFYMWTVKDEFKALLNDNIFTLSIDYFTAINEDYIKCFFTDEQISIIKLKLEKYYSRNKNTLIVENYLNGNFDYVVEMVKNDYKNIIDYEKSINNNMNNDDMRIEVPVLREVYHIVNKIDNMNSNNYKNNYYYGMFKNLIFIYNNLASELVDRYLLRQTKLGVDFNTLFNSDLLNMFNSDEKNILMNIYDNHIKNGIKVYKGRKLYSKYEYSNSIHAVNSILELQGSCEDIYHSMHYDFNYLPGNLKQAIKSAASVLNENALSRIKKIYLEYKKYIDDLQKAKKDANKNRQIEEISKIIEVLLEDDINIDVYFSKTSTLKAEFKRIIDFMKKNTPELYAKYLKVKQFKIKEACEKIENEIRTKDIFNEIDYHMITNISYDDVKKYYKENNFELYIKFSKYIQSVSDFEILTDNQLQIFYKSRQTISVSKIDGTKYMVEPTIEDKMGIINFLKNIGAPITERNIDNALKRYFSDSIDIDKFISSKVKEYKID